MARASLTNNAVSTLSAAITTTGATSLTVVSAAAFPAITGGQYFYATLLDAANIPEIVKVTAVVSNTFTIVRAQDNTAARTFTSGASVRLNLVAVVMNELAPLDSPTFTGTVAFPTFGGNFDFSSATTRITGDFANATVTSRVFFKSRNTNGNTFVGAIPDGTGSQAGFYSYGASDPTNGSWGGILTVGTTEVRVESSRSGSGTWAPMNFYTGGASRMSIAADGTVTAESTPAIKDATKKVANMEAVDRLRSLMPSTTSGTLVLTDRGARVPVTAGITVPASIFAADDVVTIYNNSASAITITQGASLTMYNSGTAGTGNRTLGPRGMATVVFHSATVCAISGAGLS